MTSKSTLKPSSAQVWFGENQSLISLETARWREEFARKYPQAVLTRLEYDKSKESELTRELHQAVYGAGLFASERLVILINFLKSESKGDLAEEIKKLLEHLPPKVFILLIERNKPVWSRGLPAAIAKLIEDNKLTKREFVNLSLTELEKWLVARAKAEGGNLPLNSARVLVSLVGNDLLRLTQEVNKLVAYKGTASIQVSDINLLVISDLPPEPFALAESIARRDFKSAHNIIEHELKNGVSAQQIVGLMAWQLRTLTNVRMVVGDMDSKVSAKDIANTLKIHQFVVTKALQYLPYYSLTRLQELYADLSNLDIKLKTSRIEPLVLFDLFLSNLVGGNPH